jgi:hypothetical protein
MSRSNFPPLDAPHRSTWAHTFSGVSLLALNASIARSSEEKECARSDQRHQGHKVEDGSIRKILDQYTREQGKDEAAEAACHSAEPSYSA